MNDSARPSGGTKPATIACDACREKHLKCDGEQQSRYCSRCRSKGFDCNWTESRRGTKKAPTAKSSYTSYNNTPNFTNTFSTTYGFNAVGAVGAVGAAGNLPNVTGIGAMQVMSPAQTFSDPDGSSPETSGSSAFSPSNGTNLRSEEEYLINYYYTSFHAAHPILVPRACYNQAQYPDYLRIVVNYIGAHYAPSYSGDPIRPQALALLRDSEDQSPEMVQALLLFALASHLRFEPGDAMEALDKAVSMAINLGMQFDQFSLSQSNRDPVYIESIRRTWWELFIIDGYLAAVHRQTTFRTRDVMMTTSLPCEDSCYSGSVLMPPPTNLVMFEGRLWAEEDIQFSSYAYRIDAIRILAQVIAISRTTDAQANVIEAIDQDIAGWKNHLPQDKASIVDRNSGVDPLMFQAFTFIHLASIMLHWPRSGLTIGLPKSAEVACAQQHMEQVPATSSQHVTKVLAASRDMTKLGSLPVEQDSPLFICGLVFACLVQASACHHYPRDSSTPDTRRRVTFVLGAIKARGRTWPVAEVVFPRLRRYANEAFTSPIVALAPATNDSSMAVGTVMGHFPDFQPDYNWNPIFEAQEMGNLPMTSDEMQGFETAPS